ncbi:hypothetical protein [Cohnella herbarum]|uniref:Uncharacterized protein n=1 Tax=Cohnella herbarum TaxID=2728023 RepID=A0A7Z2ZR02_9BACL|nr:hypothetical protein [Cohnella herbarum]QJD83274.1 hypothetical protein HH215_08885 [Cohnella herbarum]QJD88610.1 hypothetical protein HH215_35825 [Cohnella herbarum]
MSWSTYLFKEIENDEEVIYYFSPNKNDLKENMGKIRLDKTAEMISELKPYSGDNGPYGFYIKQAGYCLAKCFKNGEYPETVSRYI